MEPNPTANDEATPLLQGEQANDDADPTDGDFSPEYFLPVSLFAALAMSSTAATAYFVYTILLCKDPRDCRDGETSRYAGAIAITTCISNILGLSTLGFLQKLATKRRLGLVFWMVCRSMNAVMLLVGVSLDNGYIALSGRIFEGVASDNLLHFLLNAVYAQARDEEKVSSLISYSLALYVLGISISPFVAGLFRDFKASFFVALGLFALSVTYLLIGVPKRSFQSKSYGTRSAETSVTSRWYSTVLYPLRPFQEKPIRLLIGFSLFAYNVVQSYVFNVLLVHTSVRFGFTSRENGFLISMVHSVAALYIFINIYLIPRMTEISLQPSSTRKRNFVLALISLAVQSSASVTFGFAYRPWHVYALTLLFAIGIPTPSFIKSYFVSLFEGADKPTALASLTMMETLGSLLGAPLLGGAQSYFAAADAVFFVAFGIQIFSLVLFSIAGAT